MPKVIEVEIPETSKIRETLRVMDFADAYQATLTDTQMSVQEIYEAVFGDEPKWVSHLMNIRGKFAAVLGLKHDTDGIRVDAADVDGKKYQVGKRIGFFTVQLVEPGELIVGDDDKHLNFRISIYKSSWQGAQTVTVSTVVEIHNMLGKLYMLVVKPFHKRISRAMLQRAVDAGRL